MKSPNSQQASTEAPSLEAVQAAMVYNPPKAKTLSPQEVAQQAKEIQEQVAPSAWGAGDPVSNPDSIENMWLEGLDAMAEKSKGKVAPKNIKDLDPRDTKHKRRVRVLSDVHCGGCWARDKETQNLFMTLLSEMSQGNSPDGGVPITHLVLLGDIWDWWLIPLGEAIPKPDKLFRATDAYGYNVPEIIDLMKRISKHTKIYAVRGNHDDENNGALNAQAFGGAVQWMEDAFEMNGIWFEHGHIIDMYSNPPVAPDGQKKKGFAYFETRAGAEEDGWQCRHRTKRPAGKRKEQYIDFMRKSVEMVDKPFFMDKNPATIMWSNWYLKNVVALPQNFVKTHLRWVLKQANPSFKNADYEAVPVAGFGKDQTVEFESRKQEYTLGDAIKDHTYDMELLANKFGSQHALSRLYASGLENHFKWFKASRNHMLVVTGHTHNPYLSRMRRDKPQHSITDDVVYANSGAWAQDSYQRDHTSYVDIEMHQLNEPVAKNAIRVGEWYPHKVQLFEYPDASPRDEQQVPFPQRRPGGFDLWLHPDPNEMVVGPKQDVGSYSPAGFENYANPLSKDSGVKVPWMKNQPLLKYPTPSWDVEDKSL